MPGAMEGGPLLVTLELGGRESDGVFTVPTT